MAVLETPSIALGPAIAKYLLKKCLGEGLPNEILAAPAGLLKEKGKEAVDLRAEARLVARIGETIAEGMQPIYAHEFLELSEQEREVVARTAAGTLEGVPLTAEKLVSMRLDPKRICQIGHPDAARVEEVRKKGG